MIQDHAAVHARSDGEGNPRREVGLDQPRHHVHRRALRCDDQVDAGGARQLRQTGNGALGLVRRDHHQVGQFVNHYHQEGQFLAALRRHAGVVIRDITRPDLGEPVIAVVHFPRHPLQRANHALDLHHHRRQQVRDAIVIGQLHPFRVNQDQAQIVGGVVEQETGQDGIDAHRFARAGRTGNQQVRHGRQVRNDRMSGHVLAQGKFQGRTPALEDLGLDHLPQCDQGHLLVRHLDADVIPSWDRGLDADALRGQRQGHVIGQRDNLGNAHARPPVARLDELRLDAEHGDDRAAADLDHLAGRSEGGQRLFDQPSASLDVLLVDGRRHADFQDVLDGGQHPGDGWLAAHAGLDCHGWGRRRPWRGGWMWDRREVIRWGY